MRIAGLLIAASLAGCASQPSQPPAPPKPQPPQAIAAAADEHRVKVDASNVADVQLAGYKLVNKQGEALYCRTDTITGSRIRTHTVCLTEKQLFDQMSATKQTMEHLSSHQVGPNGH